jgi:hypothetical protein
MSDLLDTLPGPAGLFRSVANLSSVGWQQEREARARLERWCVGCGQTASFGYGVTLTSDGAWSCADPDCRAAAEAATAPPVADQSDLFGRAA